MENRIKCELCGLDCSMQISATHLRAKHNMTTKEYRALGYETLSPARLHQLRQNPVAMGTVKRNYGEDHPNWKGGHIARNGYKIVSKRGKTNLYEHRVVAEEMIGRPLEKDEVVHHIDGNRSNNSPENLVVMKRQEHNQLPREGIARIFHTGEAVESASRALKEAGWSIHRISLALRVEASTVKRWLSRKIWTK